ncbi:hypothetical protein ACYOEI_07780, partial [Singulisphaera rosea]
LTGFLVPSTRASVDLPKGEDQDDEDEDEEADNDLFGPDDRLNARTHAGGEIASFLKDLINEDWAKVRNFLKDRRSLSFPDRMHRRLESVEPWGEAMAWRWWLRHRRPTSPGRLSGLIRSVGRDGELAEGAAPRTRGCRRP